MGTEFEENEEYIYEVNESYELRHESNDKIRSIASSIWVRAIFPAIVTVIFLYMVKILQYFLFVILLLLTCGLSGTMGVPEPLSFEILIGGFFISYIVSIFFMGK